MKIKNYESDHTRFMREFLQSNPQLVEKQKRYRATWWDRPQDLRERNTLDEAKVPHEGYAYYHNP